MRLGLTLSLKGEGRREKGERRTENGERRTEKGRSAGILDTRHNYGIHTIQHILISLRHPKILRSKLPWRLEIIETTSYPIISPTLLSLIEGN